VVIIYYQGKESIETNGRVLFHASDRTIGSDYLERFFANVPGAQILFLDVTREPEAILSRIDWPEHIGVLRYAWKREGTIPLEAQLLESVAAATSSVMRMADIESYVSDRYRTLKATYADALTYEPYLPESLGDLAIGAGTGGEP
jgi:hypothetical protein